MIINSIGLYSSSRTLSVQLHRQICIDRYVPPAFKKLTFLAVNRQWHPPPIMTLFS